MIAYLIISTLLLPLTAYLAKNPFLRKTDKGFEGFDSDGIWIILVIATFPVCATAWCIWRIFSKQSKDQQS